MSQSKSVKSAIKFLEKERAISKLRRPENIRHYDLAIESLENSCSMKEAALDEVVKRCHAARNGHISVSGKPYGIKLEELERIINQMKEIESGCLKPTNLNVLQTLSVSEFADLLHNSTPYVTEDNGYHRLSIYVRDHIYDIHDDFMDILLWLKSLVEEED